MKKEKSKLKKLSLSVLYALLIVVGFCMLVLGVIWCLLHQPYPYLLIGIVVFVFVYLLTSEFYENID